MKKEYTLPTFWIIILVVLASIGFTTLFIIFPFVMKAINRCFMGGA